MDGTRRELVWRHAKAGGGYIMYVQYMGGANIQAGSKDFIEPYSDREEARWRSAIDELQDHRLIQDSEYKGENFRMTKLGYDVADEIEGRMTPRASS